MTTDPQDAELWRQLLAHAQRGVPLEQLINAVSRAAQGQVPAVRAELLRATPGMLGEHKAATASFLAHVREVWGDALDAMYAIYVSVEEVGSDLQNVNGPESDVAFDVIAGLHARACLVLLEVHTLLSQGFPLGAFARARTLHETATVALAIQIAARELELEEVAVRFVEHQAIDLRRDLIVAQEAGMEVDEDELGELTDARAELIGRYGESFGFDYGWAAPLFPALGANGRVRFVLLDEFAESKLSRFDYRISNHHVHASARAVALSMYEHEGQAYRLTGQTDVGLEPAASMALHSALASVHAIVFGQSELPALTDLLSLFTLNAMVDDSVRLFDAAGGAQEEG